MASPSNTVEEAAVKNKMLDGIVGGNMAQWHTHVANFKSDLHYWHFMRVGNVKLDVDAESSIGDSLHALLL